MLGCSPTHAAMRARIFIPSGDFPPSKPTGRRPNRIASRSPIRGAYLLQPAARGRHCALRSAQHGHHARCNAGPQGCGCSCRGAQVRAPRAARGRARGRTHPRGPAGCRDRSPRARVAAGMRCWRGAAEAEAVVLQRGCGARGRGTPPAPPRGALPRKRPRRPQRSSCGWGAPRAPTRWAQRRRRVQRGGGVTNHGDSACRGRPVRAVGAPPARLPRSAPGTPRALGG